jgi:hypothetical protein
MVDNEYRHGVGHTWKRQSKMETKQGGEKGAIRIDDHLIVHS